MIKLIIFDLSQVCFNLEEPGFLADFCKKHDLDYETFDKEYQSLLLRTEVDEISGVDLWTELLKKFNIDETPRKIIEEMMERKKAYEDTLSFVNSLRTKVKTAYLTNYNKSYWDKIGEKYDMSNWFDYGIASYMIKSRKPAPKGFQTIMKHFGVTPEETIFTDDSERNLTEAKKLSITTIHFKDLEQFKEELEKR